MASLINSPPQSELGSIVVTTINNDIVKMLAPQCTIELSGIPSASGQEMVRLYLKTLFTPQEQEQVELLLGELSFLPLAIVRAAAFINMMGITIPEYRTLLSDKRRASAFGGQEPNGVLIASADDPVAATWLISFEQLRRAHPTAANYLSFMGCVDSKDVPLELLASTSNGKTEDAIRILGAYALITRRPADSAVDLHRLVHHAMQEWLRQHQLLDQLTKKAVARLDRVFPDDDHRNRHKWRRLLPHAQTALSRSFGASY
jgi:hypothetical protein